MPNSFLVCKAKCCVMHCLRSVVYWEELASHCRESDAGTVT